MRRRGARVRLGRRPASPASSATIARRRSHAASPRGLREIAERLARGTSALARAASSLPSR